MVRATVAEVKKLFGGTLPPNWSTEANVTNLCGQVDYELEGKAAPHSLSSTDTAVVQLANELVYRRMIHADWAHGGGHVSGMPEPVIWTREMLERFDRILTDSSYKGATYLKLQEES